VVAGLAAVQPGGAAHATTPSPTNYVIAAPAATTPASAPAGTVPHNPLGPYQVKVTKNIQYGGAPAAQLDLYQPVGARPGRPIVDVIHGGGWVAGDKSRPDVTKSGQYFASWGFLVAGVNYTLASRAAPGFPRQVNQVEQSVRWLKAHARRYGGNPKLLGLSGGSAGGTLAADAGLELDQRQPGTVLSVVSLSGALNLPLLGKTFRHDESCGSKGGACIRLPNQTHVPEFVGCKSLKTCPRRLLKRASPSTNINPASPTFLIFNSTNELAPLTQATTMAAKLRAASVPVKLHIFPGTGHAAAYAPLAAPVILSYLKTHLVPGMVRRGTGAPTSPPPTSPSIVPTSTTPISTQAAHGHSGLRRGLFTALAIAVAAALYLLLESIRRRRRRRKQQEEFERQQALRNYS
jgi:acetyl esterase/lipase